MRIKPEFLVYSCDQSLGGVSRYGARGADTHSLTYAIVLFRAVHCTWNFAQVRIRNAHGQNCKYRGVAKGRRMVRTLPPPLPRRAVESKERYNKFKMKNFDLLR
jgi:hypothetical protein